VHRLPREVLWKRVHHCTSTKFWLGVIRWVHELHEWPSYIPAGNVYYVQSSTNLHTLQIIYWFVLYHGKLNIKNSIHWYTNSPMWQWRLEVRRRKEWIILIVLSLLPHNLAYLWNPRAYLLCALSFVHLKLHPYILWQMWVKLAFVGVWQVVLELQESLVKLDDLLKLGIRPRRKLIFFS